MKTKLKELEKLGLLIYLCEGTKSKRQNRCDPEQIEFVSTDPLLIIIFIKFLRKILDIKENKLRGRLQIHEDVNEKRAKKYWSKISGIPVTQFQKSIIKEIKQQKTHYNKLNYGTFVVRYASKEKYNQLIQMLMILKQKLKRDMG